MRAVRRTLFAALTVCACAVLPAAAVAAPDYVPEPGPEVTAEAAHQHEEEVSPLAPALQELQKPSVRALPEAQQAQLLGIAADGPGSLIRDEHGILVNARFEDGVLARLPALRRLGGEIQGTSQRYQEVTLSVPYRQLDELAEVHGLASVTPAQTPVLRDLTVDQCQGGSVVSEGVEQLKVELLREELAAPPVEPDDEGEGLTIGVLSDSFDQGTEAIAGGPIATKAPNDVNTKDLPGAPGNECAGQADPVHDLKDYLFEEGQQPPFDEGRAMLQIVHDIAPKAKLAFYSAFNSEADFAKGIEELAKPIADGGTVGANVIVDDVSYFEEPFFQDGPVAAAVDNVVADGVTYLTSAGNDNLLAGKDEIASWETPDYTDSLDCPPAVRSLGGHDCLDFNGGPTVDRTFGIKVKAGSTLTVDLQWAEPWNGVGTDLDAYLLDSEGRLLTLKRERNVKITQRPVEWMQWTNGSGAEATVQLVVNRFSGGTPVTKFILLENGSEGVTGTEYPKSGGGNVVGPSVYGHAGAGAAITVGAVPYTATPAKTVEPYSSRGPVTHYYFPVNGTSPAPAIPGGPHVISKPDVLATDCGRTTFFARRTAPGIWRFCGTSASAPHAAGIAALAIEGKGGAATPSQVRNALAGTGVAIPEFGSCAAGGGLLEAFGAVRGIQGDPAHPEVPPAACVPPNASGAVERAAGDWGRESPLNPPEEPETPVTPPLTPNPPAPNPPPEIPPNPETKTAPATSITAHPKKVVRTSRARVKVRFRFAASEGGASFLCQFDGSVYRGCTAKVSRWFGLGPHVVKVKAQADGLLDRSPAVFRFKIVRDSSAQR